jgi:hypothetical protein
VGHRDACGEGAEHRAGAGLSVGGEAGDPFKPGDVAIIHGLVRCADWNGRLVTVKSHPYPVGDYGTDGRGHEQVVDLREVENSIATRFLTRVREGEIVDPARTCELHGTPLVGGQGEAIYGLWTAEREYREARDRLFPHSELRLGQGCFYSPNWPETLPVFMCPACREAELEWKPFSETF